MTERHSIASRLIIKALNKGNFGGNIISKEIKSSIDLPMYGSETRMARQSLVMLAYVASRTLP